MFVMCTPRQLSKNRGFLFENSGNICQSALSSHLFCAHLQNTKYTCIKTLRSINKNTLWLYCCYFQNFRLIISMDIFNERFYLMLIVLFWVSQYWDIWTQLNSLSNPRFIYIPKGTSRFLSVIFVQKLPFLSDVILFVGFSLEFWGYTSSQVWE